MAIQFDATGELAFRTASVPARFPLSVVFFLRVDGDSGQSNPAWVRYGDAAGTIRQSIQVNSMGATNIVQIDAQTSGGDSTGTVFTVGAWRAVGVRVHSTGSALETYSYLDGAPWEVQGSADIADTSPAIAIGGTGADSPLMSIAGLRIWSVELSDAEFLAEAASLTPVRTSNLWANYVFENGALGTDASGNSRTLSLNGTPSFTADPSVGSPTGSLAQTLGALALAAAGTSPRNGVVAVTLGPVTASGAAGLQVQGLLAQTLGALTGAATGVLPVTGVLSQTLGTATLAATAALSLTGTAAVTLGPLTASSVAGLQVQGVLVQTLGELTLSATGEGLVTTTGVLEATLAGLVLSASGVLPLTGDLTAGLGPLVAGGAAGLQVQGVLAQTLEGLTLAATGAAPVVGALAQTLEAAGLVSTGVGQQQTSGELAVTLAPMLASGAAGLQVQGLLAQTLGALTANASGRVDIAGALGVSLAPLQLTGAGQGPGLFAVLDATLGTLTLHAAGIAGREPVYASIPFNRMRQSDRRHGATEYQGTRPVPGSADGSRRGM